MMHLNLFTQCSPSPQLEGLWRYPGDGSACGYRTLGYWTALAHRLEAACIDALFFADSHGTFDVYRGSWEPAVRHAVQIPSIDPLLVVPALAAATRHLGFAVTYSTTYHPPYECARVFSSLDHLTGGRIGWNVVTSFLASASDNGLGEALAHDVRYDRADEYVRVARRLWEESWDGDAVVRDAAADLFTDPDRVHPIDHVGASFRVRGPHQCEPSPQRTPVLYQAGASPRGISFAARHAEVIFLTATDPGAIAAQAATLRRAVADAGRRPDDVKLLTGALTLVGRTGEEVRATTRLVASLLSPEGSAAKWCGWTGVDLAAFPDDALVADLHTDASRSVLELLRHASPERAWTVGDLRQFVALGARPHRRNALVGTPVQVADRMEEWMAAGIDGFNLLPCPPTSGIEGICDLLVPELQRRGVFRRVYDPTELTLRERYFGAGCRWPIHALR
jgi:FMN-dependent oxidoreductase (nitrilotriacetate monooxygenase family)